MKPLIAAVAAVAVAIVVVAAILGFVLYHRAGAGPDPFAGSYPLITPSPSSTASPGPAWRPSGPPAGPLPTFRGTGSHVAGRTTDRAAGVSYARFAAPWHAIPRLSHSGGEEIKSKATAEDYPHFWYVAVYSDPLDARFDVPGPDRLRAAAELAGRDYASLFSGGTRTEIAGAPMTIDRHRAWVTAFRITQPPGQKSVAVFHTEVAIAIDTGRRPAVVQIQVPSNQNRLLPDVNAVVRSLRVIR